MLQHVIRTQCIVGKLVLSNTRIWVIDLNGGKGIRASKFIQVGMSLADISFLKFRMLDVDVIGNTNFHGKDL